MEEVSARRLVFCDLETAGLDPKRHAIIQLAAVAVDETLEVVEAFEAKVRFNERRANKNSLRKNHYHPGVWAKEAQEEKRVARGFADFLRRHTSVSMTSAKGDAYFVAQLVAHNSAFDGSFLQAWYERTGVFLPARRQVLCTMQRAMWWFSEHPDLVPPKDYKLATLCHYFGVPFHAASAHEALADVSATVQLYKALCVQEPRTARQFAA
jgi:DNA polymerase III epsilon subunit-like protein